MKFVLGLAVSAFVIVWAATVGAADGTARSSHSVAPSPAVDPCAAPAGLWGPFDMLPHVRQALSTDKDLVIVALGSSSTEGIGATAPGTSYPAQLEALLRQRFAGVRIKVLNKGIGGETVADNLRRLDRDALAAKPDLVIWQVGTNDAFQNKEADEVYGGIIEGIHRIQAANADVALMEQQFFPEREQTQALQSSLDMVRKAARSTHVIELPRYDLMRYWIKNGQFTPATMLIADKMHMTDASYKCLAARVADLMPATGHLVAETQTPAPLR
jgi:acyl-CoA thioesterase-1